VGSAAPAGYATYRVGRFKMNTGLLSELSEIFGADVTVMLLSDKVGEEPLHGGWPKTFVNNIATFSSNPQNTS
jgi:hypothetical protein